jgi:AraC-like DNA-binding protein
MPHRPSDDRPRRPGAPPAARDAPHRCPYELLAGEVAHVRDVECSAPRSPAGDDEHATAHLVIVQRAGVYVRHPAGRARARTAPVVADLTHAVLLNADERYRVSHPTDCGDASTVIALAPAVAREVAVAHDRRAWPDGAPAYAATHAPVAPATRLRLAALRAGLRAGTVSVAAAEEEALTLVDAVLRAAALRGADRRGAPDASAARRAATRRARRELAEAVKEILARDPAAAVPLAALARSVAASPYHLTRVFHAEVGAPIHRYHLRLRLALAVERLGDAAHDGRPGALSALAHDLGFANHGHFTRAFRREYGATPSAAGAAIAARGSRARPAPLRSA